MAASRVVLTGCWPPCLRMPASTSFWGGGRLGLDWLGYKHGLVNVCGPSRRVRLCFVGGEGCEERLQAGLCRPGAGPPAFGCLWRPQVCELCKLQKWRGCVWPSCVWACVLHMRMWHNGVLTDSTVR
jgi:hypothetical protein